MATDIVSGLFGLSPYQVQEQRNQQMQNFAAQQAQLNATQRGVQGMTMAGGQLAGAVAPMLGMIDPAMQQAQMAQTAAQGVDTTSAKGLSEFATRLQKMGMYPQALAAANAAREAAAKEATTSRTLAQEELDWQKALTEMSKSQREKYSAYGQQLIDAGYKPGTPEFIAEMKKYLSAEITNKTKPTGTVVNIDQTQEKEFVKELGKGQAKDLLEGRSAAEDAAQTLDTIKTGRQLLSSGIISGTAANVRLGFGKALKTAGIDYGLDDIANTEAFVANMAQNVGRNIKLFGAGTGLSDADRQYAEKMAGGTIELSKESIAKILDINERAARNIIARQNRKAKGIQTNIPLTVDVPETNKTSDLVSQIPTSTQGKRIVVREVLLKDGRTGVEYSDGTRGFK